MRIAVLGGGNGAYAAAADLGAQGHEVRLWRRDGAALDPIIARGHLTMEDAQGARDVAIGRPTKDIGEAVRGAELILLPTPAFAQEPIARHLAPHLRDGQVIYLTPGTFGSYVMMATLRDEGCRAEVAIAETGTLPWLARKHGNTAIAITTRATRLPTGVFPARLAPSAIEVIMRAFPAAIEPVEDALSAALMNAGPIIHPPLMILNAAPIQHFDRWDIHNEGTQPAVRKVHDALDGERIATREALGYGAPHFPLADHYETSDWMYGNLAHDKLVGSGDWRESLNLRDHRYIREDMAMGLAFLASVAAWAGVPCPVAKGLLTLGGIIAGPGFREAGRTLATLGLADKSRSEMEALLHAGLA